MAEVADKQQADRGADRETFSNESLNDGLLSLPSSLACAILKSPYCLAHGTEGSLVQGGVCPCSLPIPEKQGSFLPLPRLPGKQRREQGGHQGHPGRETMPGTLLLRPGVVSRCLPGRADAQHPPAPTLGVQTAPGRSARQGLGRPLLSCPHGSVKPHVVWSHSLGLPRGNDFSVA